MRNLVTSLFEHEQIVTTEAKAKALRPYAERLITMGKKGDLHARRQALRHVRSKETTRKLFEEIAPRYSERPGGYTRMVKTGRREGDAAPMALVQLIPEGERFRNESRRKRRKKQADAPASAPATEAASSGAESSPEGDAGA